MNTGILICEFLKGRSSAEIYHGDTSEAPYVLTQLIAFEKAASKPAESGNSVEARCEELFRNNQAFIKRIQEEGVTFYDEQQNPVWSTKDPELVLQALAMTGQRHFGPIIGGPGPRI